MARVCLGAIFKSQEKAVGGGQGARLVIVLPTVATMGMDGAENKGDNSAWIGSKNKGREREKNRSLGGVSQAARISCSSRAA